MSKSEIEAESKAGSEPKISEEPKAEVSSEVDARTRTYAKIEVDAEPKEDAEPKVEAESKADVRPLKRSKPRVAKEPKAAAEPKADLKPEADEEPGPDEEPSKVGGRPSRRSRPVKRRKRSTRRKHRKLAIAIVLAVLAAVVVVINLPYFNVENISVVGNKRVEDAEIKRLSEMEDEKSIIGLNSLLAPQKVKVNPYVESAKIKRKFPSTIQIIVTEKVPFAQLATPKKENKKRKWVAIDQEGTVLEIGDSRMDMTYIKEVDVVEAKLREKIKVSDEVSYKKAMDLAATAVDNDMYFMRITIQGSWVDACVYDELYCRGRYKNIENALKEGTLKTVVYRLYQQNVNEGTINVADNDYCSFTDKT